MNKFNEHEPTTLHKKGHNPEKCCESVWREGAWHSKQCERKRGFGPELAYCKQHDPAAKQAREAVRDAKYEIELKAARIQWAGPAFLEALKQIANGHNDHRAIAAEAIKDFI